MRVIGSDRIALQVPVRSGWDHLSNGESLPVILDQEEGERKMNLAITIFLGITHLLSP